MDTTSHYVWEIYHEGSVIVLLIEKNAGLKAALEADEYVA